MSGPRFRCSSESQGEPGRRVWPRPNACAEISRCRTMTDQPFGVNLTFLPAVTPPDYPGFIQAIIDEQVTIVETAGNNPQQWLPALMLPSASPSALKTRRGSSSS